MAYINNVEQFGKFMEVGEKARLVKKLLGRLSSPGSKGSQPYQVIISLFLEQA
jgi:hypothetical protein